MIRVGYKEIVRVTASVDVGKSGNGTQSESPGLGGVVGKNRPQRGCLWQPYTRTQSKQGEARRSKLVNDKRSHFRWVRGAADTA